MKHIIRFFIGFFILFPSVSSAYVISGNGKHSFSTLLHSSADCSASNCPSGAYFIASTDEPSALYTLGTVIGGSQDGATSGVTSQWSNKRFAILIGDGNYQMSGPFKLNYYTEVLGVSTSRDNVTVVPGIDVLNDCNVSGKPPYPQVCLTTGGLNNFWRGLANITIDPKNLGNDLRFAVSQASPMRNIHLLLRHFTNWQGIKHKENLLLCDWNTPTWACGYTSGGFMSNVKIDSNLLAGSQQQFYIYNTTFSQLQSGMWNIVSHNNTGSLQPNPLDPNTYYSKTYPWIGTAPFTQLSTSAILHKPRLVYSAQAKSQQWQAYIGNHKVGSADHFTILTSNSDSPTEVFAEDIKKMNTDLATSRGLIIMPGVYHLQGTIKIPSHKVVLGIGIPTLRCASDKGSCMLTGNEDVRLAGILFEAGSNGLSQDADNTLLTVGTAGANTSSEKNPDILQDIYCRIARTDHQQTTSPAAYSCVTINADYTIGQNLWLWRADHDAVSSDGHKTEENSLVTWDQDQAMYGLIVNGDHVVMNGLAVEHFQNYQTVWNGKHGTLRFYQSEMPYIMPAPFHIKKSPQRQIACFKPKSSSFVSAHEVCPSLYVTSHATGFKGYGLGVYSYFPSTFNNGKTQNTITAEAAIKIANDNVLLQNVVTRWLNGDQNSGIASQLETVLNNGAGKTIFLKKSGVTGGGAGGHKGRTGYATGVIAKPAAPPGS